MTTAGKLYFDYNGTVPVLKEAIDAILEISGLPLNPSSIHAFGRNAKAMMESARQDIASMMGVNLRKDEYSLIFTSSATEANNLIIKNFSNKRILVSAVEHVSILGHAEFGDKIDALPVDSNGIVLLDHLEGWLKQNAGHCLVSIMFINNETGVIQPIGEISALVHRYGGLMHSDCVQVPGKHTVCITDLGLDFISISSHKFGGPAGAAALLHKTQHQINPQIIGGGQERGARSGTENILGIVGFGAAARVVTDNRYDFHKAYNLRNMLEEEVLKITKDAICFGSSAQRAPNTSMIYMPGVTSDLQIISFDMNGIAVSSGAACSSGKVKVSHVLSAMGVPEDIAKCAIRFSIGPDTTESEVQTLINTWRDIYLKSLV